MPKIDRVYHRYEALEEYQRGMWRIVRGHDRIHNAELARDLMRDSQAFKAAMMRAVNEWPVSCEHNLTCEDSNRLAWLGHAGCLLGVGSPEENTRIGWHMLNQSEQDEANRVAQEVLDFWESAYQKTDQMDLFHA